MKRESPTSILITCPHCNNSWQTEVYSFSWHEVDHRFWSDGFVEGDDWFAPSYTKLCPFCNHYFPTMQIKDSNLSEKPWPISERLTLQQLKEAIIELADGGELEALIRLEAWHSYNDWLRKDSESDISLEAREFNQANMQWLLDYSSKKVPSPYSIVFELLRLLGRVDEYKELIRDLTYEKYIEWRNARNAERGVISSLDEEQLKGLYNRFVKVKLQAFQNPLRPYIH